MNINNIPNMPLCISKLITILSNKVEQESYSSDKYSYSWHLLDENNKSIGNITYYKTIDAWTIKKENMHCGYWEKEDKNQEQITLYITNKKETYQAIINFGTTPFIHIRNTEQKNDNYNFCLNDEQEVLYYSWTNPNSNSHKNEWVRLTKEANHYAYEFSIKNLLDKNLEKDADTWEKENYSIRFENAEEKGKIKITRFFIEHSTNETILHEYTIKGALEDIITLQAASFNNFRKKVNELLSTQRDIFSILFTENNFDPKISEFFSPVLIHNKKELY